MDEKRFTFGVEEEFLLLDKQTGIPARPSVDFFHSSPGQFHFKPEAHACVIESVSDVLNTPEALSKHIRYSRHVLSQRADDHGMNIYTGGTHSYYDGNDLPFTNKPEYHALLNEHRMLLQENFLFGQHIHIGSFEDSEAPKIFNGLRPLLPILIALTANSLYWQGRETGLASSRMVLFNRLPRTGIAPQMKSVTDTMNQIEKMLENNVITKPTSIWHDHRYHPIYKTIEIRVMDMNHNVETSVLGAILPILFARSIVAENDNSFLNHFPSSMPDWMIEHNRWQGIRYGKNAIFLTAQGEHVSFKFLLCQLLLTFGSDIQEIDAAAYQALALLAE
jgi:carboxylate-amine ligase